MLMFTLDLPCLVNVGFWFHKMRGMEGNTNLYKVSLAYISFLLYKDLFQKVFMLVEWLWLKVCQNVSGGWFVILISTARQFSGLYFWEKLNSNLYNNVELYLFNEKFTCIKETLDLRQQLLTNEKVLTYIYFFEWMLGFLFTL